MIRLIRVGLFATVFALVAGLWLATLLAQEGPIPPTAPTPTAPTATPTTTTATSPTAPPAGTKWCDLYFLKGDMSQMLCFDQTGAMRPEVRQAYVWFSGEGTITARLFVWYGKYKPTKPVHEMWYLREFHVIEQPAFQTKVDEAYAASRAATTATAR